MLFRSIDAFRMESVDSFSLAKYTSYRLVARLALTIPYVFGIKVSLRSTHLTMKGDGPMDRVLGALSTIEKGECIMQNVNARDRHGHTPLIDAAKAGDAETVKDLLKRGADVDARSDKGKAALHYAAANGHVDVVRILIENGATVDARDREGHTPLMFATIYGCNHTVQALITSGADIRARTLAGNTAMVYAENNGRPLALALLKKAQRTKEGSA